jgi:phosphoglucosamine mutase
LTHTHRFAVGVVISASHNPWQDNGIKLFGPDGYKLPDAVELDIEEEIFRQLAGLTTTPQQTIPPEVNEADRAEYVRFLLAAVPGLSLDGRRVVIDCANGAASSVAPQLFANLGGEVIITNASPDGRNINEACGALHPEVVAAQVRRHQASMGITFDGDADRALFADENGCVVNGDAVLLLAGRDLQARGLLTNSTVVATTMSNMGLEAALKRSGIQMLRAAVGDKYVLEQMIHRSGRSLAELVADLKVFPQVIVNVKVREKKPLEGIPTVAAAIRAAETDLAESGRVVIRYSGTEALARVMIEAESEPLMRHHADTIAAAIRTELGI